MSDFVVGSGRRPHLEAGCSACLSLLEVQVVWLDPLGPCWVSLALNAWHCGRGGGLLRPVAIECVQQQGPRVWLEPAPGPQVCSASWGGRRRAPDSASAGAYLMWVGSGLTYLDFVTFFRLRLQSSLQVLCVIRVLPKWRCGKRTRSRSFRPAVGQCPAEGSSPWESGSPAPGGHACYVAACSSGRVPGTHSPLGGVVTCRWIGSDANFSWKTV